MSSLRMHLLTLPLEVRLRIAAFRWHAGGKVIRGFRGWRMCDDGIPRSNVRGNSANLLMTIKEAYAPVLLAAEANKRPETIRIALSEMSTQHDADHTPVLLDIGYTFCCEMNHDLVDVWDVMPDGDLLNHEGLTMSVNEMNSS